MTPSVKILMTTDVSNNKWDYTDLVCKSILASQKAQITLVTTGQSYEPKEVDYAECIHTGISVKWENNFQKFKMANERVGDAINEISKNFKPDIMHLNHYCDNIDYPVPKILTVHGDALNNIKWTSFNMHYHPYKNYIQKCLDSSDKVIATTKILAKNLISSYEMNKQINLIYNGIEWDVPESEKDGMVLLTSSKSLLKKHNLNMILQIMQRLPDDMQIFVIGSKPAWLRLPEKLQFLGNISNEELKPYYQKASIYLALSSWDIFNMNAFYAAYAGCALLACDSPIFQEFWGDSASFFDMSNSDNFMRQLNNLLENKLVLDKVVNNCRNKAMSAYGQKRMGYEYLNLYKNSQPKERISAKTEEQIKEDIFIQK
ncbi:MAG: glycosyltransferase [Candidatus Gastranaerophilales bacterium]|nr:glycosyltransferase [Candidatus Gastranaerophilales bacterium]